MSKKTLIDIKPPRRFFKKASNYDIEKHVDETNENGRRFNFKNIVLVSLAIVFTLSGLSLAQVFYFKNHAPASLVQVQYNLQYFVSAVSSLDLKQADKSLSDAKKIISRLERSSYIAQFWGLAIPKLKNVGTVFDGLNDLTDALIEINDEFAYLKNQTFQLLTNYGGRTLIGKLDFIVQKLDKILEATNNLKASALALGYLDNKFTAPSRQLNSATDVLRRLIDWLSSSEPRNLVLLFQNPSEIRPAGGFIGSYAELQLAQASLTNLKVSDIYDPDGQLPIKIIPPKPLQFITPTWGARDANWFFDFPASAQKVVTMLETSKIYQEKDIAFDGVIAVNVRVVENILEIVGPVALDQYGTTINSDNFLAEVQREVESGDDKKAGEPKRILKILMPVLFQRLGQLNDKQKLALFNKLQENLINKDIMIYLKDNDLENYLQIWGLGGEIYSTILDTNVDYLAVVNANVAGGKSDAFIKQDIILRSRIDERGAVTNDLTIKRDHRGADEEDWWYRATNKNYLQVLTSRDASLQSISGGVYKVAPVFSKIGYQADTELKAIEGTAMLLKNGVVEEFYQFGKKTFATWLDVPVGKQKQINLKYQRDNVIKVADGERYQFVFDKQSGVESDLEINIEAPSGYKWRENNSDTFTYKTSSVPGRLILDLTLTK